MISTRPWTTCAHIWNEGPVGHALFDLVAFRGPTAFRPALELVSNPEENIAVSIVSLWEIAIKSGLGKLDVEGGVDGVLARLPEMGFDMLGLSNEHIATIARLPLHHRDPFDRMLLAQAKHEGMHILTADAHFGAYDVPLIEA